MSHRRRGVGVGRSGATKKYAQKKADEMKATSLQSALDTVESLEIKLTEFAKKHQSEIQNDPVFRQRFLQMCAPLGVDPLQASKKSFWSQLLGMGDFYHELAVKVAEVCLASRSRNGGIISVTEVQKILAKRKTRLGAASASDHKVSKADINMAIGKLAKLGGGFRTVQVGKSTMIISVPQELDNDHMEVMAVATNHQTSTQGITVDDVMTNTGWDRERSQRGLDLLLTEGIAWLDEYRGISYYWVSSVWQEQQEGGSNEEYMC